ncbi:ABC transporter ATP-binding protein [Candidatus Sumerlaeota bacterium]|nr:ABC transporter ATP-binding protein [Candidatus Sumerlaeota bacterium]
MTDKQKKPVLLSAQQVSREYVDGERKLEVLRGVDLDVHEGEFVSIIGQSGSGKSTLLHLLGALDRCSSGTVKLRDQDYAALSDAALAQVRTTHVGFVYQFHHLLPEFTALENVMLPGMIARGSQGTVADRARALLDRVGLSERLNHRPTKLSGGEQQRVALARALMNNPSVVLADEPTGNLDAKTSGEVLQFLTEITVMEGKSLVMVTHDQSIAKRANRCFHLQGGKLTGSTG